MIIASTKQLSSQTLAPEGFYKKKKTFPLISQHQSNLAITPVIHRSPACACGGGCPRCQGEAVGQPELKISTPGDKYEREADRVADQIMRVPEPAANPEKPSTQSLSTPTVSSSQMEVLGGGRPLSESVRSYFEPRFGQDFSHVRVHTDANAIEAARAVNARAFTLGRHVVFGAGEYTPEKEAGKRLLSHELTHVVQQSQSGFGGKAIRTQRAPQFLQRKPGQDPTDSWNALVVRVTMPKSPQRQEAAKEAIRRFLATKSGGQRINALWHIFCGGRKKCKSKIVIEFVTSLPKSLGYAAGVFDPEYPDATLYTVSVLSYLPKPPESRSITLPGLWPSAKAPLKIALSATDPESNMAETIYHELLHIWFIHARRQEQFPGIIFPTGHGTDVEKGQIEPEFLSELQKFANDIGNLEKQIHNRAKESRQTVPPPQIPTSLPEPSETKSAPTPQKSSPFGGAVFVRGGGFGTQAIPSGATGILGADLLLGKIYSLRLGARGIYLTPDHLLAGGAVGLRVLQEEPKLYQNTIKNPLFFDLEAGVLGELPVSESEKLKNKAHFLVSAGFGQEIGRDGPRFFWRVGGFVLISDKGDVLGGGTVGAGVRF